MKIYVDSRREKQANTIMGSGNPHWKGGRIDKHCVRCGSPFQVYPSTSDRTHCSLLCANRDTAKNNESQLRPTIARFGEDNPAWNGGDKTYFCQLCGIAFSSNPRASRKFCSKRCNAKFHFTGDKNSNWKGGITPENEKIRKSEQFIEWRNEVYERDNFTCQECDKHGGDLNAHHIKAFALYPELRFDLDNGMTLCVPCHRDTF